MAHPFYYEANCFQVHWNYYLLIDDDLCRLREYIAFHPENLKSFSNYIHKLIVSSCVEIESVLLAWCRMIRKEPRACFNGKRTWSFKRLLSEIINTLPQNLELSGFKFIVPGFEEGVEISLFESLNGISRPTEPDRIVEPPWWSAYTGLKHNRQFAFAQSATLENALGAAGALKLLISLAGALACPQSDMSTTEIINKQAHFLGIPKLGSRLECMPCGMKGLVIDMRVDTSGDIAHPYRWQVSIMG